MIDAQDDPIAQMEAEHEQLRGLNDQWRALEVQVPVAQRQALVDQICTQLTIHLRLEEELLDPLAREAFGTAGIPVADLQARAAARDMVRRLLSMKPADPRYDANVNRLCEAIERHIACQRDYLFPRLRRCGADLALLGRRLRERRRELEAVSEALREEVLVSAMA